MSDLAFSVSPSNPLVGLNPETGEVVAVASPQAPSDFRPLPQVADGNAVLMFSKPACVQCDATKRWMDKRGISYDVVDISADPWAETLVRALGFQQAPVLFGANDTKWSGFSPDHLRAVSEATALAATA